MNMHGHSFIGNQLRPGTAESFQAVSPIDDAILPTAFHHAGTREVDDALTLAEDAFVSYRTSTGEQRALFLERIGDEILTLGDSLIHQARLETGLTETRLVGERARTIGQLKLFAQIARESSWVDARIDTALPDRQPARPDLRRMLIPLGPVVVFGSSNFPLAFSVAGGDTASALATGNPVVVKAHSGHPGTSELVATAVRRAVVNSHLHPGVFSMLHGSGKVIGTALVRHPLTRAVGFTGSRAAGRALFDAAASRPHPIPVFAEMSSLNPVFVLPEAMRQNGGKIADGLRASITLGVGQFCTKPGLVFGIAGAEFTEFAGALRHSFLNLSPETMLNAGICQAYHNGLDRLAALDGVALLAKSSHPADPKRTHGEPAVWETNAQNFQKHPALTEEVFGPSAVLISAGSFTELEYVANSLDGQLTVTVHGTPNDLQQARILLQILERKAGRLVINGFPTGVEVSPAMNHGGPYPATTDVRFTSVGTAALFRFVRPICYQAFPAGQLPDALQNENPLRIWRLVNGALSRDHIIP